MKKLKYLEDCMHKQEEQIKMMNKHFSVLRYFILFFLILTFSARTYRRQIMKQLMATRTVMNITSGSSTRFKRNNYETNNFPQCLFYYIRRFSVFSVIFFIIQVQQINLNYHEKLFNNKFI